MEAGGARQGQRGLEQSSGGRGRPGTGYLQSRGQSPTCRPAAIPAAHRDPCRSSFPGSPPVGFPSGLARGGHQRASGLRRKEARAFVPLPLSCVASPLRVQPWALVASGPPPPTRGSGVLSPAGAWPSALPTRSWRLPA